MSETARPGETAPKNAVHKISVESLVKIYRGRKVVDGVSLDFSQGEIVGLLGPNGAGKSTTFYMIVGLVKADGGKVLLDERVINRVPMYQRARLGIGYLAQEASVFRKLTVRENILLVLEMIGYPKKQRAERVAELLEELQVTHKADSRAYELSGGQRRRVEIARALAANPSFLLLDEPFAGIDPKVREDISEVIQQLRARGLGVLITDHDASATLKLTDRAYIVADGAVVVSGESKALATNAIARQYYLGENFTL